MSNFIVLNTRLLAWLNAVEYLLDVEKDLNVFLQIASPGSNGSVSRNADILVDRFLVEEGEYPLHTVAETIFPGWQYARHGLRGVFETYPEKEYPLIKDQWGRYAYRLVRRRTASGSVINPLERLIRKMRDENGNAGSKTACYELGVAEGEYDVPLYNTVVDASRRMGGPCLSHLSFKLFHGAVHLQATYRSHDYRHKALGNLLGLARLQACVAKEVGVEIGTLAVHSTYAWLSSGKGKARLRELVRALRELTESEGSYGLVQ